MAMVIFGNCWYSIKNRFSSVRKLVQKYSMKKRGDHSINRPGAWTHSEQGVEEVLLCQPHQEHFTEKSMEGNYMEKKEIVRQIHVRLEFLSIKNLKLVLSFINGLRS